jgi:hypothetical protein
MAKEADEHVPAGDGAEQVSGGRDEQAGEDHNEGEFSR